MRSADDVRRALESRGWLGECLLEDVQWLHRGHVLRLRFAYFFEEVDGHLRITEAALKVPGEVVVDAVMVLACRLDNAPTDAVLHGAPEDLPWGLDEVAAVDAAGDTYENQWVDTVDCIRVSVRWEVDRYIELWCREVAVETTRLPNSGP